MRTCRQLLVASLLKRGQIWQHADGKFYTSEPSPEGMKVYLQNLTNGERFANVREVGVTIDAYKAQALATGKKIADSTLSIRYGMEEGFTPDGNKVNGRMDFLAYSNPFDPTDGVGHHAFTILEAQRNGWFVDPESATRAPQYLEKGQLVILGSGGVHFVQHQMLRQSNPIPQLLRVFGQDPAAQDVQWSPLEGKGLLPKFFGQGAEAIKGTWGKSAVTINGKTDQLWSVFKVTNGGIIKDTNGGETVLKEGETYQIVQTQAGAENYADFNTQWTPRYGVTLVDRQTLIADWKEQATARGLKNPDMEISKDAKGKPVTYKIPGTSIVCNILEPNVGDPFAPVILVPTKPVTYNDRLLGNVEVNPAAGGYFILDVPIKHQMAIKGVTDTNPNAVAIIDSEKYGILPAKNVSDLDGVQLVGALTPNQKAQVPYLTDLALVQVGKDGNVIGQVQMWNKGLEWMAQYMGGYGYIQLNAGVESVTLLKATRDGLPLASRATETLPLSGMVGIGLKTAKAGSGEINFWQMVANSRPVDGRNWVSGAELLDSSGKPIGKIIFGEKAPQGDPHLTGNKVAAVYFLDGHTENQYWSKDDVYKQGSRIVYIVKKPGTKDEWVHADWDPVTQRWYEFTRAAITIDGKKTTVIRKNPKPLEGIDVTDKNATHGVINDNETNEDVIAVVDFAKTKNGTPVLSPSLMNPIKKQVGLPLSTLTGNDPSQMIYSVIDGEVTPIFSVDSQGKIKELYEVKTQADFSRTISTRRVGPAFDANRPSFAGNLDQQYQAAQIQGKSSPIFEVQTYDPIGRLIAVNQGGNAQNNPIWHTQLNYVGSSNQFDSSTLSRKGQFVQNVYGVSPVTLEEAMQGRLPDNWKKSVAKADQSAVFSAFHYNRLDVQAPDFHLDTVLAQLPADAQKQLKTAGLGPDQLLSPVVVYRDDGVMRIDYRLPNSERVLFSAIGPSGFILHTDWNEEDAPVRSFPLTPTLEVMGEYKLTGKRSGRLGHERQRQTFIPTICGANFGDRSEVDWDK